MVTEQSAMNAKCNAFESIRKAQLHSVCSADTYSGGPLLKTDCKDDYRNLKGKVTPLKERITCRVRGLTLLFEIIK